jgi:hypothetical protein
MMRITEFMGTLVTAAPDPLAKLETVKASRLRFSMETDPDSPKSVGVVGAAGIYLLMKVIQ